MKFALIDAERTRFSVPWLCKRLQVSRSGYYAWRHRSKEPKADRDHGLLERIREVRRESRGTYGSPRIYRELRDRGMLAGRHRIARLMRENGISSRRRRRFVCTTQSAHSLPIAPNLLNRAFDVPAPNHAWFTDITYIPTHEGWLFLAVVMDLYSRRIVGWAMDRTMKTQLVLQALNMATLQRKPAVGLLHHSDRGSQYASAVYQRALSRHGMLCSMSRKAECYENAVIESFFGTLKTELVYARPTFADRNEARAALFDYIEVFYNRRRMHSRLGYMPPVMYEHDRQSDLAA